MLVAALGAQAEIAGYGLAGATLCPAEGPDEVRAAWRALPEQIGLVILTRLAAEALTGLPSWPQGRLVAVMPP